MAVAAVAGLAAGASAAAAGLTVFGLAATTLAGFTAAFALGAGLSIVSRALMPTPSMGAQMQGNSVTVREPAVSRKIIYGRARVGGAIVYLDSTGTDNEYLHLVVAVAGHAIDGFEEVWFNDTKVWDGSFQGNWGSYVHIGFHDGTQTTADGTLVSASTGWTNDHKLLDTAYIYVRLKYDTDQFAQGLPNISTVVRGKKVYNPVSATTAWSQNPALCVFDYLKDTKYGLAESASNVNTTALIAAQSLCDETVNLSGGGSQQRYVLDGVVDTANSRKDNIEAMLSSMGGKLIYSGGEYFIVGAEYNTPTITVDESVLVGGISVKTKQSRRSLYNGVKGVYLAEEENYTLADYPSITSSSYSTEDGDPIYLDMPLPFTTNNVRAQRIAKIALLQSRQQTQITIPCNLAALKFKAGDNIMVTNSRMGWTQKVFEVTGYQLDITTDGAIIVNVDAIETASAIFDWATSDQQDFTTGGEVDLYDGFTTQPPTNLAATSTTTVASDGTLLPSLRLTWTDSTDVFVTQYEVQYQRGSALVDYGNITDAYTTNTDQGLITNAASITLDYGSIDDPVATDEPNYNSVFVTTNQYVITGVVPSANYNVRIRAVNNLGVKSNFVTLSGLAEGDTDPCGIPDSLSAVGGLKEVSLSWIIPTEPDYSHVEVWENIVNNSATATKIATASGDNFARTGLGYNVLRYYWVKSVDYSGNVSAFSSVASATTLFVDTDSFSQAVNDLFQEAGAYGIEPVSSLPSTGDFNGQIKYLTTTNKLYRWDSSTSAWTDDIFSITSGSVDAASFTSGIEPISIVNSLPSPSGYTGPQLVFLTTDYKLYRYNGSAFVSSIAAGDITGTIGSDVFPSNLRPVEIVSTLPTSGNFQGRQVFLTSDNKLYRYNGTSFIASVATSDLQGQVSSTQISDNSISTAKIQADAITANKIATGAVTADAITAGSISAAAIAADAITSDKIAANAVTAGAIQAGAVSTDALAANVITSDKIAAGAIQTSDLAANSITGGLIAASGVITSAAQINDAVITNAKIANLAVTDSKISGAIQSADYSSGSSGWKIDKNGSAELNNATFRGALDAATGNFGDVTIASGGSLSSGQTAFDTGTGFFLGKVSGTPKFSIGSSSRSMTWDGSRLELKGVDRVVEAGAVPFLVSSKVTYITSSSYVLLRRLYVGATGSLRVYRTFASTGSGSVTVQVRKSGSSSGLSYSTSSSTPQTGYQTYTGLDTDDYFEIWGKRNSIGGQLELSSFGFYATEGAPTITFEL